MRRIRKKYVSFQEKENKPPFEIECLMDDIIDEVKLNLIDFFKKHNIFHPIVLDLRFDEHFDIIKDYQYIDVKGKPTIGYQMLAFHKNTLKYKYGRYVKEIECGNYLIMNRYRGFQVNHKEYYLFQKKSQSKNNLLRQQLENILNGNIKIKKIKNK